MVEGQTVLRHETRKMIYNHILVHPGVSFNILKKIFDLNDSTLRYHLNYLEKKEKISFGLERGRRYYYPNENDRVLYRNSDATGTIEPYELSKVQEHIIGTLQKYPGINQKELIKRTGINRLTLNKNIKKLMTLCIVRKVPDGNKVCYKYLETEQLRHEILKRLFIKLLRKEIDEETFLNLSRKLD